MLKRKISAALAAALCTAALCSCGTSAPEPSAPLGSEPEVTPSSAAPKGSEDVPAEKNEKSAAAIEAFSNELFRLCAAENTGDNTLVSPYSVYMALAMLQNGAKGQTQDELLDILSGYIRQSGAEVDYADHTPITPDAINAEMNRRLKDINGSDVLSVANGMFIMKREDLVMQKDFQATLEKMYFAEIFEEVYSDNTVGNINSWVKKNTHNMIPEMLSPEALNDNTVSVLLNAAAFEGKWAQEYEDADVYEQDFTNLDGSKSTVEFLHGTEGEYLESETATGFIKQYKEDKNGRHFAFAALLPNEDITVDEYIAALTPGEITEMIENAEGYDVHTVMPKFTFDNEYHLPDAIKQMGAKTVFDKYLSDLTGIAKPRAGETLFVSDIVHKTHIELDEKGTRAAAATAIIIEKNDEMEVVEFRDVVLDRPFVFAIYDLDESTPVFLGAVRTLQ